MPFVINAGQAGEAGPPGPPASSQTTLWQPLVLEAPGTSQAQYRTQLAEQILQIQGQVSFTTPFTSNTIIATIVLSGPVFPSITVAPLTAIAQGQSVPVTANLVMNSNGALSIYPQGTDAIQTIWFAHSLPLLGVGGTELEMPTDPAFLAAMASVQPGSAPAGSAPAARVAAIVSWLGDRALVGVMVPVRAASAVYRAGNRLDAWVFAQGRRGWRGVVEVGEWFWSQRPVGPHGLAGAAGASWQRLNALAVASVRRRRR